MAIHAQMYSENLGFSLMSSQDLAGENGRGGGGGIGQFCQLPLLKQQWRKWDEQKQHHKQSTAMQIQNENQCFASNFSAFPSKYTSSTAINDQIPLQFYQSIAPHVEMETSELDQYIKLQNDRLIWALQEQVKQQVWSVLRRIESKTMFLLRQKEEEIVHAKKTTMEMEEFLRKLETENQVWQRVAQENEAMVISLNNTLDQMRATASSCFLANAAEDAESCYDTNNENVETEEAKIMDANRGGRKWPAICSSCNSRQSCVIFLPCRHLCSCRACEAVLDSCPVCFTEKIATVEALIF